MGGQGAGVGEWLGVGVGVGVDVGEGVGVGTGVGVGVGEGAGLEPEPSDRVLTCFVISEPTAATIAALPATIIKPNALIISAYSEAELPSSLRMKRLIIPVPHRPFVKTF